MEGVVLKLRVLSAPSQTDPPSLLFFFDTYFTSQTFFCHPLLFRLAHAFYQSPLFHFVTSILSFIEYTCIPPSLSPPTKRFALVETRQKPWTTVDHGLRALDKAKIRTSRLRKATGRHSPMNNSGTRIMQLLRALDKDKF